MSLIKDLLYTKGNAALDITRVSVLFTVLAFWGGVFYHTYQSKEFDPLAVGGGIAAIFGAAGGWMHFRDKSGAPTDAGTTE